MSQNRDKTVNRHRLSSLLITDKRAGIQQHIFTKTCVNGLFFNFFLLLNQTNGHGKHVLLRDMKILEICRLLSVHFKSQN